VAIAAALATIELIETRYRDNAAQLGEYLMSKIRDWPQRFPLVGDVRGRGLMVGIELVLDKKTKQPAEKQKQQLLQMAYERGLILLGCGASTIRLMPPLMVSRAQTDFALEVIADCLGRIKLDTGVYNA
jgi:4-aminobutyrate aminotransferase